MAESENDKKTGRSRKQHRGRRRRAAASAALILLLLAAVGGGVFGGMKLHRRLSGSRTAGPAPAPDRGRTVEPETLQEADPLQLEKKEERSPEEEAARRLEEMTVEEKAAQLFIVTPEQLTGYTVVTAAGDATKKALDKYPVGGLVYFKPNLASPDQVRTMLEKTRQYSLDRSGFPVFLGVDEEGGTVARVGSQEAFGVEKIGDMAKIGAGGDPNRAHEAGSAIGGYLRDLGFNLDFAPVADVCPEPAGSPMAKRSFGSDPELVADMALAEMKGLEESGIKAVLKHFPGLGSAKDDTHLTSAYVDKDLKELLESDLIPFQSGIAEGADFIMISHVSAPKVIGDDTPSSLSEVMISDVLRGQLGYDGLVVTDAMNMKAVTDRYEADEAAVAAVRAGADLLLMPEDFPAAYEGILKAVKSGEISQERLDQSVERILKVKHALGGV